MMKNQAGKNLQCTHGRRLLVFFCTLHLLLPETSNAQSMDARAAAQALNAIVAKVTDLEDRVTIVEEGWNKLLNVAVIGFRTNQCPAGWEPISNTNALLVSGKDGANSFLRLGGMELKLSSREDSVQGLPAQKILFCVRSSIR